MYLNICNLIHRDLYPLVSRSSNFPFRNPNSKELPDFVRKSPWASSSPSHWASQDDLRKPLLQRCQEPEGASEGCHLLPWRHQGASRGRRIRYGLNIPWLFSCFRIGWRKNLQGTPFFVAAKNPGSLWFPVRFSNLFHQPIHWQHDFAAFPYSARATSPAQELELVLPPGRSATNGSETFWNWRICRLKNHFIATWYYCKKNMLINTFDVR